MRVSLSLSDEYSDITALAETWMTSKYANYLIRQALFLLMLVQHETLH